jgi:hypothetical protein
MIGYQDKINQILRGAETIKNSKDTKMNETDENGRLVKKWDVKDVEELKSLVEKLEKVELERDALWVKTQEDEREINDLRDVNKQLREEIEKLKELHTLNFMSDMLPMEKLQKQRDEAIELVKEIMPFAAFDLDNDRFGLITELQTRFEELMLEVS